MSIELKIPEVGESVREVQIGRWLKREGDAVALDENVVELETDKASMELPRPPPASSARFSRSEGDMVAVGDVIGYLENGDGAKPRTSAEAARAAEAASLPRRAPAATAPPAKPRARRQRNTPKHTTDDIAVTPAARRAFASTA